MDRTDHGGSKKVCFKVSEEDQEDSGHDTMSYRDSYRWGQAGGSRGVWCEWPVAQLRPPPWERIRGHFPGSSGTGRCCPAMWFWGGGLGRAPQHAPDAPFGSPAPALTLQGPSPGGHHPSFLPWFHSTHVDGMWSKEKSRSAVCFKISVRPLVSATNTIFT